MIELIIGIILIVGGVYLLYTTKNKSIRNMQGCMDFIDQEYDENIEEVETN